LVVGVEVGGGVGAGDGDAITDGIALELGLATMATASPDGGVCDVPFKDDWATGCGADELPPLMPAPIRTTAQAAQRIAFVRGDHFVRTIRITTVIGKNRIAATTTSHRGKQPDRLVWIDAVA